MLYRQDGGRRHVGPACVGWSAAFWVVGASRAAPPAGAKNGVLDEGHTSNMAEYVGLQESMERALRHAAVDRRVIFELDSQLVARQVGERVTH